MKCQQKRRNVYHNWWTLGHLLSLKKKKILPSFCSPFFAEEALDGLLDRNGPPFTHSLWSWSEKYLILIWVVLGLSKTASLTYSVYHSSYSSSLAFSICVSRNDANSVNRGRIVWKRAAPEKVGKAANSWALVQTGCTTATLAALNTRAGRGPT